MNLYKAIQREKNKLKKKAEKSGVYENFGQKEVSELEDKYIDLSDYSVKMNCNRMLIADFSNWCMNYTG